MKTKFHTFLLLGAIALSISTGSAEIKSKYIGPDNGLYSDPANWSNGVPINNTFHAINNTDFIIRLDIDPTIKSLTLGADSGRLFGTDHNFTVTGNTDMGAGNRIDVVAQSLLNVKFDLGNLKNFSGKTLNSGRYFVTAAPCTTSKLQFNPANNFTNGGYMVARPGGTYTFNGSFACVTNPANIDAGLF